MGQRSTAAWEGHCLSLAIGGNCPARVGPVGRVSLEDGQPTTVARLLLRHWLNTWLGTARLRAYVRKSHTRLVGNRPQGRLAAQSSSSSAVWNLTPESSNNLYVEILQKVRNS